MATTTKNWRKKSYICNNFLQFNIYYTHFSSEEHENEH